MRIEVKMKVFLKLLNSLQQKALKFQGIFFRSAESEIRLVINKVIVEVGKSQEYLYILDLLQLRPILNCLNFIRSHG